MRIASRLHKSALAGHIYQTRIRESGEGTHQTDGGCLRLAVLVGKEAVSSWKQISGEAICTRIRKGSRVEAQERIGSRSTSPAEYWASSVK